MPALEPIVGWRVVATPVALDRATWRGRDVIVLRFAPDEAFGIGAAGVECDDPDAIAEPERGLVGAWLDPLELARVAAHIDWPLPAPAGVLAQGKIGGVPARLRTGEQALLVTHAAYAHELADRLGWLA